MPEHGIPVELETPRGTLVFNQYGETSYARLVEFTIAAGVRSAVEALPRRDGSIVSDAFRNGATPILKGEIVARETTPEASLAARSTMLDEIRSHAISLLRADGILRWTPSGQATRRLAVRCLEDPQDGGGVLKTFQIALVSRSAHVESDELRVVNFSTLGLDPSGDVSFPTSLPLTFGDGVPAGAALPTNEGDTDVFPLVRLTGPMTDPTLRNVTTGRELALVGLTIAEGEFVEIDMAAESVKLNGVTSKIGTVDPLNADFWTLVEGANELRLSAVTYDVGHGAAIYFRDAFA